MRIEESEGLWMMTSFWHWFFVGSGAGPGFRRLFDLWLVVHLAVGITLSLLVPISLESAANGLLLPLAGIFIGLSFAWGGNAQALIQTNEIMQLAGKRKGGFLEYLYTYQLAILLILVSLTCWALAGLGIFDQVWPLEQQSCEYKVLSAVLFSLASITLRECWHVVVGAQAMLAIRLSLREMQRNEKQG